MVGGLDVSFLSKVGAFETGTGAAASTVAVTGVGFQPKALIFWWTGITGTIDLFAEGNIKRGIGVATSTTSRWAVGTQGVDASASSDTDRIQREDACVATLSTLGAVEGLLDLQSFDADGFTMVVDDAFPVSLRIHYMALGGTDLTNVKTGRWDVPAVTGNEDITGVGFQPDFVLFGSTNFQNDPPSLAAGADLMVGAAVSSSQQAVLFVRDLNAQTTMDTYAYCLAGECIGMGTGPNIRATFVSFLPDGFRVNWLEVVATPITFYLALKGGSYAIGDFLTSTSNGATIAESGLGFQPKGTMLFSHGRAQDTANALSAGDQWNIGGFTSTTNRGTQGTLSADNVTDAFLQFYVEHNAALAQITATPARVGLLDVQSIDADGFTLVMDSAADPAAFVWYISFGDTGGPATHEGTGSSSVVVTTSGTGQPTHKATGSSSVVVTTTATGLHTGVRTGSADVVVTTTGFGVVQGNNQGAGSSSIVVTTTATGQATRLGTGAASVVITCTAAGQIPAQVGTGAVVIVVSASAAGASDATTIPIWPVSTNPEWEVV